MTHRAVNDLVFVRGTVALLQHAGVKVWVFGGWAEELLGLIAPRAHRDLDLLFPAENFDRVDDLLAADRSLEEITEKRFAHKRAFVRQDVRIELILVHRHLGSAYVTEFWGRLRYEWPPDLLAGGEFAGLRLASRAALQRYRADYDMIRGYTCSNGK